MSDPFARNFGEAMGSFMPIDLTSESPAEGLFSSNAAIDELVRLESMLVRLAPPSWPEDVFGKMTATRPKRARRCLCNTVRAAIMPGLTDGPNRTGMASASS